VAINEVSGAGVGSLGIGLSFGLVAMVAIYAVGHISEAQINPAVTVAFTRHFPWSLMPIYVLAQLLGACAASAVHLALFGDVSPTWAPPSLPAPPCRRPSWRYCSPSS
jgi:aquaporin NIP